MSYNKSIAPGILIKSKTGLGYEYHPEDHLYILTEIKTNGYYDQDVLVFYDLTEERFFPVYRWHFDESIGNGTADIVV